MIKTAIIGATGYVGEELVRILALHPRVELSYLTSQSFVGQNYSNIYRNFKHITEKELLEENMDELADKVDVLFFALPHGMACKKIKPEMLDKIKIIDLGADFRLKSQDIYEEWYNVQHEAPELLGQAVYGLCELKREQVKSAKLVANPGCYTTCSILTLYPLVKAGLLEKDSVIIDAKSGVTGAGRSLNLDTHFTECNESIKAYKIASHRHTPEIEQELGTNITFTPHLVPMQRGILATCYAKLKDKTTSYEDIREIYLKYYGNEHFVRIMDKDVFPETRWVRNSNFCDIGFKIDKRTGNIILVGAIDNLVKGASGQAVQNMNIMFGLDERIGIDNVPACL